jgi:hypothetical protein
MDGLLIDTAPAGLRNRALALTGAGIMFTQGAGFALWGIAGQYLPVTVVILLAATAGVLAAALLRPRRLAQVELVQRRGAHHRPDTYLDICGLMSVGRCRRAPSAVPGHLGGNGRTDASR